MAWKVMSELEDMMKPRETNVEISDRLVQMSIQERRIKEYFNEVIYGYLREHKIGIGEVGKKEFDEMTEGYTPKQKRMFTEQFTKALTTNRGKPIQRIRENKKSVLLNELD